jgi:thymidylate synthase (FAD)
MFWPVSHVPWRPENADFYTGGDGNDLVEFAGRACYQSWSRPNKATASNRDYIANLLKQGHESVLEHASATFYIEGVSRSLTHELIRHRHLSFSELSQRFVNVEDADIVYPPAYTYSEGAKESVHRSVDLAQQVYEDLVSKSTGLTRKQAREAARAVMPNCLETKIVVTGNIRAWRHFITVRATEHADAEICRLAVEIFEELVGELGDACFQDMEIKIKADGKKIVVRNS